ncbi:unnamed protein product, partial [Didymodactylos carnosus]
MKKLLASFLTNKARIKGAKRALEFGGGPALWSSFLLAQFAEQIRFTDYTQSNLRQVEEWLNKGPNAHDWTAIFDMMIDEYREQSDDKSASRSEWETSLRRALQAGGLSPCIDLNAIDKKCPVLDEEAKES